MTRKERIDELKRFIEMNQNIWKNPIYQRQILVSFAVKWGLKTDTVLDYFEQIKNIKAI